MKKISDNDIYMDIVDDKLKLFSENQNLDTQLLEEIKNRKSEIISYLMDNQSFNSENDKYESIPKIKTDSCYELSDAQKRLWILSQIEDSSVAYNISNRVELPGSYDIQKFKKAINSVIDRHEILRTVFKENDEGEVKQWVLSREELNFDIDYHDLRNTKDVNDSINIFSKEDSFKPFDLVNGPLIRASLFQISEEEYVFYYNMHHLISDGWSKDILIKDVLAYYEAYLRNAQPNLPELKIQYKDYSAWQLSQKEGQEYGKCKEYWVNTLSGELPTLDLPGNKTRPKIKTFNGRSLSSYINSDIVKKLQNYSQEQGGSLFMGLLSAWNVLCYRYTSQKDIITGTPVAGREHGDLENQIGFYVNTLALRNKIIPDENFDDLYDRVKKSTLSAFSNQQYTFDSLVSELDIKTDTSRNPIFDAILVLQNLQDDNSSIILDSNTANRIIDRGSNASKFDLEIIFQETGGNLLFNINYNIDVYDGEMIKGLMCHYRQLLSKILLDPSKPLRAIDYLSEEEKGVLLGEFNATSSS
ncbi:condensation domain-containing protein, partial [Aquimarina sp. M1]